MGEKPDALAIAYKQVAKWRRQREKEEHKQKENRQPIKIDYGDQIVTYNQNTSRDELELLKANYEAGRFQEKITEREYNRLSRWVQSWEKWQQDTALLDSMAAKQAKKIDSIHLNISGEDPGIFTRDSDLSRLKQIKRLHDREDVFLHASEYKALERWIKTKERIEPIRLDMGPGAAPLVYQKDDPRESLELLAKVGKEALEEKEYKKLWGWIYEKERQELDQPIKIRTKTSEQLITRHDEKDQLQSIVRAWHNGDLWAKKQLTEKDFQKIQKWLSEKERRR